VKKSFDYWKKLHANEQLEQFSKDNEGFRKNILEKCKEIINIINEPLCDCPFCKGRGVVTETESDKIKKTLNGT